MDIDDDELALVGAKNPISIDDYIQQHGKTPAILNLAGKDWTQLAGSLINEFDGVTVTDTNLIDNFIDKMILSKSEVFLQNNEGCNKFRRFTESLKNESINNCRLEKKKIYEKLIDIIYDAIKKNKINNKFISDSKENIFNSVGTSKENNFKKINHINQSPDDCIIRLENVTNKFATGWALSEKNINSRIFLKLTLSNKDICLVDTNKYRDDVKKVYGGQGFYGFHAELNEYLDFSNKNQISIESTLHLPSIKNKSVNLNKLFPSLFKGMHFKEINETAKKLIRNNIKSFNLSKDKIVNEVRVSIIILNLNGFEILKKCLDSIYKNTNGNFEVIVIDHGSSDGSIEFLKNCRYKNLKSFYRNKNYSFSESNNFAANHANGDILVFMNNDMIVVNDIINDITKTIMFTDYGLVGVKLWDMPQGLPSEYSMYNNIIQHIGVHFKDTYRSQYIDAFESRCGVNFICENGIYETPAVTAALVGIKASEFKVIGGFTEKYFYGQEDVDFCIKYLRSNLRKTGVILNKGVYHARGLSRRILSKTNDSYLSKNKLNLQDQQAKWFRKYFRYQKTIRPGYLTPKPYSIAMIVSEISFDTEKADYFTARELGDSLENDFEVCVGYFESKSTQLDVNGYDAIIVFIDNFNPTTFINLPPDTILIAWARNWFDRWCERPWIQMYDLIFASSEVAQKFMCEILQRKVSVLRIAASNKCFESIKKREDFVSDYCFTGSYFNSPRDIADLLEPSTIPHKFALYGHNWEKHENFMKYTRGPVNYNSIPEIYASSKLVVDDANVATKKWGAINCRVYDAIAAGTLCITNNSIGVSEIFDNEFPVYDSSELLHFNINRLLTDNELRIGLQKKYSEIVKTYHTYKNRSNDLMKSIRDYSSKMRIAIKISAPSLTESKSWGDLYFARALAKELEEYDYNVRIDCMDQWYSSRSLSDDIVICLRGLDRYLVNHTQVNILWLISHPENISLGELNDFEKIYVASEFFVDKLKKFTGLDSIEFLPQASSFSIDKLDKIKLEKTSSHEILFIGNTRGQYRDVVRWCVEENYPITVYGKGWKQFIPESYIASEFIENFNVPYLYNKSKVVLSDHWPDMKIYGFVSNRIYDVISSGGIVLTDSVSGIEMIKNPGIFIFNDKSDFIYKLDNILANPIKLSHTASDFGFNSRVKIIVDYLRTVCKSPLEMGY